MIEIRPVHGQVEYRAVEDLQKEVWSVEDREVVPAVHLIPACEVGAILLGAFDGKRMVGFVYGFPGFEGDERIIHSDMLGVREEYRDRGLGRRLKMAQRDAALELGIEKITWTFDPLQARNAHLNFHRLGVIATRYLRDFYGETTSPLHRGGTDRLWVEWLLPARPTLPPPTLRIAMPSSRDEARERFESAFAQGYVITDFDGEYLGVRSFL